MNIISLLSLGLILIPFAIYPGFDTREPKIILALGFALALSLAGIYKGIIKPVKNKWLLFLMGFLFINICLCPKPILPYQDIMVQAFWVWKVLSHLLIFFLMYITLSSIEFNDEQRNKIFKIMSWVGLVMSVYVILQYLGLDQFYNLQNWTHDKFPPSAKLGGTLGQPTIVSSFIAMLIPITLYLKKYWAAGVMALVVILCKGQVAIGALFVSLSFILAFKGKKWAIGVCAGIIAISLFLGLGSALNGKIRAFIGDSGRFSQWQQIAKDIKSPIIPELKKSYPVTGLGLGAFKYVYHIKHKNLWHEAHNDYLEILYNTGIIGLFLFLMSLWTILKGKIDRQRKYLLASFLCIAICAGAGFCFQLGAHLYYSIVILALLT